VIPVKKRKNKHFKDIISKESVLISVPSSSSTEEQLYGAVYESITGTDINNVIWVCYQQPPDIVSKKLVSHSFIFNKIEFIDMISQIMGISHGTEDAKYCMSPIDHNCLFKSIDKLIEKNGRSVVILDNLNAMMSYDMLERIIKTLRSLNNRIIHNKSVILYLETTGACGIQTAVAVRATMNYVMEFNEGGRGAKDMAWESLKNASWKDVLTINTPILSVMVLVMFLTVIFLVSLLIAILISM